jgi:muramoyltetrapeptide carboxypeptidase LdcA involved in peptidoglycan recycling
LKELLAAGYFRDCAGVVFGDMAVGASNGKKLSGKAYKAAREEMAEIRKDFASKVTCPVYEGYSYGHVSISYAIDFLREKTITADGVLKQ